MRLADLDKVRTLSQRRQKLLNDLESIKAADLLSIELTPGPGSTVVTPFKATAMSPGHRAPETDDEVLFDAVTQVLDLSFAKRVAEIDAQLVALGVCLT